MPADYRERLFGFLRSRAVGQPGELLVEDPAPRPSTAPGTGDDLAERFLSELSAVGGEAVNLGAGEDPAAELGNWLKGLGLESAAMDSDPAWELLALPVRELLASAGLAVDSVDSSVTPQELAGYDLGVTLADAAIAETGTIAQCARPFRPRAISLVPRCHLVLVPSDRLLGGLEDFFEGIDEGACWATGDADFDSYFTWITGPSRTADIEKTLTIGVHGPERTGAFLLGEGVSDG